MKTRLGSWETSPSDSHPCRRYHISYLISHISYLINRHGHFYTIPTKSEIVADGQEGLWLTEFKGVNLLTAVVDTDYDNWAVFVQCMQEEGRNKFLSTRVMSRDQTLSSDHWLLAKETIQADNLEAEYKYSIDQRNC